jgi:cold shock CspA family protein
MNAGRIKCFFPSRGYGYIEDVDGREVYFSLSAIAADAGARIADGLNVYYEAITTSLGLEALRVQLAP